jgi:hypothetical protein
MKNTIKVLGIIALAAVIGFSFVSCKENDGTRTTQVTVVNNYTNSITRVKISLGPDDIDDTNANIQAGQTKTYTLETDGAGGGNGNITLYATGLSGGSTLGSVDWQAGKTSTITLKADGSI